MNIAPPKHLTSPTVMIGHRKVAHRERTYVIAEAGVNHDGRLEKALELVDVAVAAGADAVKFQVFRAAELVTAAAGVAEYHRASGGRGQRDMLADPAGARIPSRTSQREMLAGLELSEGDFAQVRAHCVERGIEFLATPFGVHDVDRLLALHVRAIKIASTDLDNVPLLRKAADTGLPLIVSTGASTVEEIAECVERLRTWEAGDQVALLHCVSRYPTPLEAANLRAIAALRERFGVPCGFSDHTTSTRVGAWAVAAGACLLEKHFTLDCDAPGPDHSMSLDAEGFTAYVCGVREVEVALGSGAVGMTAPEGEVRAVARRSIVAAQPIRAGTVLSADLLTVKRPAGGIPPAELEALVGRHILVDVGADTTLKWDMIQ